MPTTSSAGSDFSLIMNLKSNCAHHLRDLSIDALRHVKQYQKIAAFRHKRRRQEACDIRSPIIVRQLNQVFVNCDDSSPESSRVNGSYVYENE
ncbi:TPA: hypothetical protein N0F65_007297 [Lagenidium giganteum]|uniref:Uncharacterized protein n=1 Tax=Lagenidium giganteum TaxID=4803 RepID=A0AAV2Z9U6_9STRA|nr:TPA: hypothetical protein N0F65_007297 [Lagenidium giganteum]